MFRIKLSFFHAVESSALNLRRETANNREEILFVASQTQKINKNPSGMSRADKILDKKHLWFFSLIY